MRTIIHKMSLYNRSISIEIADGPPPARSKSKEVTLRSRAKNNDVTKSGGAAGTMGRMSLLHKAG